MTSVGETTTLCHISSQLMYLFRTLLITYTGSFTAVERALLASSIKSNFLARLTLNLMLGIL